MAYVGLPEDAQVFSGLPEGAKIISPPQEKPVLVTPGDQISVAEEMDRAHGIWTPEMLRNALPSRKTVADFARPLLEGGGMIVGGLLATPGDVVSGPLATIAGAGMGYAGGKKLADFIEGTPQQEYTGNKWLDPFISTGKDVATGATMEAGGQVVGKYILEPAINGAVNLVKNGLPYTKTNTTGKVAEAFTDAMSTENPTFAAKYAQNQAEAEKLLQRVGSEQPFTPGQSTGNNRIAAIEQSLAAKDAELAGKLKEADATNIGTAANNLKTTIGNSPDLPAAVPDINIGAGQRALLQSGKDASKAEVSAAYSQVPDYQMPHTNFTETAKQITSGPLHADAEQAVQKILDYAERVPKTAKGLDELRKTIGDKIGQVSTGPNPDNNTARVLGKLKDALTADFDAMGAAAQSGDIALYNGKVVVPSQIQAEINGLTEQLQRAAAQGASLPEQNKHLFEYLAKNGEVVMQNNAVSNEQYAKALADRLKYLQTSKGIGLDYAPPTGGAVNQQVLDNLTAGIQQRQLILENLEPAEDVAAAFNTARQKAKVHFDKYGQENISNVLARGDNVGGSNMPLEAIPSRLFTQSGAQELIKAQGKQQASAMMQPHVTNEIISKVNPDGTLNIPVVTAYIRKNKAVLDAYGLTEHANQIVKDQIPAAIRARLDAANISILGDPAMGAREAAKFVGQYYPAIKQAYGGSSKEAIAMQDYAKMLQTLSRNKNVTYGGGSTSIEKLMMDAPKETLAGKIWDNVGTAIIGSGVGAMLHGGMGAIEGGIVGGMLKGTTTALRSHEKQVATALLHDAITNPETARMLLDIGRGRKVSPVTVHRAVSSALGYSLTPQ